MPGKDADYDDIAKQWQAMPTPEMSANALTTLKPLLSAGIHQYVGKDSPLIRSKAKSLTLGALKSYNPTTGPLRPHLMSNLQGLKRYAAKQQQYIAAPERVVMDSQRLHHALASLTDQLERDPSDQELADYTGLSSKRIGYVRQYQPGMLEGQMSMHGDEESGDYEPAVVARQQNNPAIDLIYDDLEPMDQLILDYSFGRNGRKALPVQAIAKRLRVTSGAISQRAAKIQRMIDELTDMELF